MNRYSFFLNKRDELIYMARRFGKKLVTFIIYEDHLQFLYDTKVSFVRHKTFLINATYIYIQQEPFFCKYVILFCAKLNIFSQVSLLLGVT